MTPSLSVILCSRNDNYMGDSRWRLETSINFLARGVTAAGLNERVEIIVCDWGSKQALRGSVSLTAEAATLTSFIDVPPTLAQELQQDSAFAEVLALNAAAQRSRGDYIGRIDQDTLVSQCWLEAFFDLVDGRRTLHVPVEAAYLFCARRQLPQQVIETKPSLAALDTIIDRVGSFTRIEEQKQFWWSAVGILLAHRNLWHACGGFDERLIYYWWMDVDLGTRLKLEYPIVNIGEELGYDFYHMEHFPLLKAKRDRRRNHRKLNPRWALSERGKVLNPNGADWGLARYDLPLRKATPSGDVRTTQPASRGLLTATVALALLNRSIDAVLRVRSWLTFPLLKRFTVNRPMSAPPSESEHTNTQHASLIEKSRYSLTPKHIKAVMRGWLPIPTQLPEELVKAARHAPATNDEPLVVNGRRYRGVQLVQHLDGNTGFTALLTYTLNGIRMALDADRLPIVYYGPGQAMRFHDPAHGDNIWEYYFEPPCGACYADLLEWVRSGRLAVGQIHSHSQREIIDWHHSDPDRIATFWARERPEDPAVWMAAKRKLGQHWVREAIHIRSSILEKAETFAARHFDAEFKIGVHIRGTDFAYAEPTPQEAYFSAIDELCEQHSSVDIRIFVATDQQQYLERFQARYGSRVIAQQCTRSSSDEVPLHMEGVSPYQKGEEVLIDILLLARCDHVIKGAAAVGEAALWFNSELTCSDFALESNFDSRGERELDSAYLRLNIGELSPLQLTLLRSRRTLEVRYAKLRKQLRLIRSAITAKIQEFRAGETHAP